MSVVLALAFFFAIVFQIQWLAYLTFSLFALYVFCRFMIYMTLFGEYNPPQ